MKLTNQFRKGIVAQEIIPIDLINKVKESLYQGEK